MCRPPRFRRGGARLLCALGTWDVGRVTLWCCVGLGGAKGAFRTKKGHFQQGVLGVRRDFVFFFLVARPSVRVRSCRIRFQSMKVLFPGAWIFERAGGTCMPGRPLIVRNNSRMNGAKPGGGSLLRSKSYRKQLIVEYDEGLQRTPELERRRQQSCVICRSLHYVQ